MSDLRQYIIEKTGLKLSEQKLLSLSRNYSVEDLLGDKIFRVAKNFVNPETSFFRNMEVVSLLKGLIKNNNRRIWFAGCSTGQEVYSTFLISEKTVDLELFGTDINYDSIFHANEGKYLIYRSKEIEKLKKYQNKNFFSISPSESLASVYVEFSKSLKKAIHFDLHNLISGPYSFENDIVICRNVLLHMTENGKMKALRSLAESVKTGGFLLLGDTDPKMNKHLWKRINKDNLVLWQKI